MFGIGARVNDWPVGHALESSFPQQRPIFIGPDQVDGNVQMPGPDANVCVLSVKLD